MKNYHEPLKLMCSLETLRDRDVCMISFSIQKLMQETKQNVALRLSILC